MSPGSKRRSKPEDDLLDLPFDAPPGAPSQLPEDQAPTAPSARPPEPSPEPAAEPVAQPSARESNLDLFDAAPAPSEELASAMDKASLVTEEAAAAALEAPMSVSVGAEEASASAQSPPATLSQRFRAGIADVMVHLLVLATVLLFLRVIGVRVTAQAWPGLVGFMASFSFLSITVPLAFWGQTPGMGWAGIKAFDREDRPLSYSQCALRWAVALATVALLGLPSLVHLGGSSLTDVVSRSRTVGG